MAKLLQVISRPTVYGYRMPTAQPYFVMVWQQPMYLAIPDFLPRRTAPGLRLWGCCTGIGAVNY